MPRIWKSIPLSVQVIGALRNMGPCDDGHLLRSLRKENDISLAELYKVLLKLEIQGFIHVSNTIKGRKKIELSGAR